MNNIRHMETLSLDDIKKYNILNTNKEKTIDVSKIIDSSMILDISLLPYSTAETIYDITRSEKLESKIINLDDVIKENNIFNPKLKNFITSEIDAKEDVIQLYVFDLNFNSDNNLEIDLVLYNGSNENIEINAFPIKIIDANNKTLIHGLYTIDMESKPRNISYSKINIENKYLLDRDFDLTNWVVNFG